MPTFLDRFRVNNHSVLTTAGALLALTLGVVLFGCSHDARPNPKDTIFRMLEAMRQSDGVALAENIDMKSAALDVLEEAPSTLPDTLDGTPDLESWLVAQMTGEGGLRDRWLTDNQIVLGRSDINGDTAHVEVSFLDRITRVQYYNKMQLVFRDGRWIITRFRTM